VIIADTNRITMNLKGEKRMNGVIRECPGPGAPGGLIKIIGYFG
jgi:hypothetical protein